MYLSFDLAVGITGIISMCYQLSACFVLVSSYFRLYLVVLCLCSFYIVTELPQPVTTEWLPAIDFFWPVNFSQVGVHWDVKKCITGSSREERLGNTVTENQLYLNRMNS
jgi:hypothetical protein